MLGPEIGDDVAVLVDPQHDPQDLASFGSRVGHRFSHEVRDPGSHRFDRRSRGEVGSNGRENIPAVKRLAHRAQEESLVRDVEGRRSGPTGLGIQHE